MLSNPPLSSQWCDYPAVLLYRIMRGLWTDALNAKPVWNARVGEDCLLRELHLKTIDESADAMRRSQGPMQ